MSKDTEYAKFSFLRLFFLLAPDISAGRRLPASSGGRVRIYPQPASSSPRLSTHIHPGDEQQASDGRGSRRQSHPS
jgi:hypothetical protein